MACEYLNQFSTAQVLIENYYLKSFNSIFIKDQLTTILANMALLENCRKEIADFNGLNLLMEFLNEKPSDYITNSSNCGNLIESDLSACERVQQKASIAISRFCKETKYCHQFIDMGVLERIIYLCQNSTERNNSDSVLIACLVYIHYILLSFIYLKIIIYSHCYIYSFFLLFIYLQSRLHYVKYHNHQQA
jgi:hypothetical protein